MSKSKFISEEIIRTVALDLVVSSTELKNIYDAFEKHGIGEVRIKHWIDSLGGPDEVRSHLSQIQLSSALLIRPAVKELHRRITEGLLSDKELVNLYQGLTGEKASSKPAVNINIDQFLKEKQTKVLEAKTEDDE